jgi:hypothetical protein
VVVTRSEETSPIAAAPQVTVEPCPPGPVVSAGPAKPPEDVTWRTLEAGHRIPLSATQGPLRTEGGVLRCFARTPMGAVLAAYIIPFMLQGPDWQQVLNRQVVSGTGREILAVRLERVAEAPMQRANGSGYVGFALDRYTPDSAIVQLLVRGATGNHTASILQLRWEGDDWRIQPGSIGELYQSAGEIHGSAGYTLWRP